MSDHARFISRLDGAARESAIPQGLQRLANTGWAMRRPGYSTGMVSYPGWVSGDDEAAPSSPILRPFRDAKVRSRRCWIAVAACTGGSPRRYGEVGNEIQRGGPQSRLSCEGWFLSASSAVRGAGALSLR